MRSIREPWMECRRCLAAVERARKEQERQDCSRIPRVKDAGWLCTRNRGHRLPCVGFAEFWDRPVGVGPCPHERATR